MLFAKIMILNHNSKEIPWENDTVISVSQEISYRVAKPQYLPLRESFTLAMMNWVVSITPSIPKVELLLTNMTALVTLLAVLTRQEQ